MWAWLTWIFLKLRWASGVRFTWAQVNALETEIARDLD
jgi:hypothetical protein